MDRKKVRGEATRLGATTRCMIDLERLRDNVSRISAFARTKGCGIMPVIKSDGYGHGILEVARAISGHRIWGLGIFELSEAKLLRAAGIELPLFLLSGLLGQDAALAPELDLTVGVVRTEELDALQAAAHAAKKRVKVHLKVDTGMARYGLVPEEAAAVARSMGRWPDIEFEGLYSHMPVADEPENPFSKGQIEQFLGLAERLKGMGLEPRFVHLANSAGLMQIPRGRFNLCRPGIAIYGAGLLKEQLGLAPVMGLESFICSLRKLAAGTHVGYGHTFTLARDSLVALVPAGYDNGYLRGLSNRAAVLVRGKRAPVIGRICMKTFLVDVTHIPDARPGDRVVMLGEQDGGSIGPDELAEMAGTISYELLCLFGRLNRREYIKG